MNILEIKIHNDEKCKDDSFTALVQVESCLWEKLSYNTDEIRGYGYNTTDALKDLSNNIKSDIEVIKNYLTLLKNTSDSIEGYLLVKDDQNYHYLRQLEIDNPAPEPGYY